MNIYIVLGLVILFLILIFKVFKGILKKICWIILIVLIVVSSNYLILPRLDREPVDMGLERFFSDVKTEIEDKDKGFREKVKEKLEVGKEKVEEKKEKVEEKLEEQKEKVKEKKDKAKEKLEEQKEKVEEAMTEEQD